MFSDAREPEIFSCLEDLLSSRQYLKEDDSSLDDDAPPSLDPTSSIDSKDPEFGSLLGRNPAPSGMRLTTAGLKKKGAAHLPASLLAPPPAPLIVPEDDDAAEEFDRAGIPINEEKFVRGIRPTYPERILLPLLSRLSWVGFGASALCGLGRLTLHNASKAFFREVGNVVEETVVERTLSMVQGLKSASEGECMEAGAAWYSTMASSGSSLSQALSVGGGVRGWAMLYLRVTLFFSLFLGIASLGLFFVHTGKPFVRFTNGTEGAAGLGGGGRMPGPAAGGGVGSEESTGGGDDSEALLERMKRRIEAEAEPTPMSRPNQLRWARAFFSLLTATLISSYSFTSMLLSLSHGPTTMSSAAKTLSLRWPAAALPPIQHSMTPMAAAIHWGVWRGAHSFGDVPLKCLEAMRDTIEPFLDAPDVARFAIIGWGGQGARGLDVFYYLPFLRGWVEVGWGGIFLVIPNESALGEAGVIAFAAFLFSVLGLLFGMEYWHTELRPWLLRRGKRLADEKVVTSRKKRGSES